MKLFWMLKLDASLAILNMSHLSLRRLFRGILHIMTVSEVDSNDLSTSNMFEVIFDDLFSTLKAYVGVSFSHFLNIVNETQPRLHIPICKNIFLAHLFRNPRPFQLPDISADFALLGLPAPGFSDLPAWLPALREFLLALKPSDSVLRKSRIAGIHLAVEIELGKVHFKDLEIYKIIHSIVAGKFFFFVGLRRQLISVSSKFLPDSQVKLLTDAMSRSPEQAILSPRALTGLLETHREKLLDITRRLGKNNLVLLAPIVPRP